MTESQFSATEAVEPDADDETYDAEPDDGDGGRPRRTVLIVAVAALVLALVAVGLSAVAYLRPTTSSCEVAAWSSVPTAGELPAGWKVTATDVYPDNQTTTITGPTPANGSAALTIYASVTCFGDHATDAIARSEQASEAAGRAVTAIDGIGETGYAIAGDTSGASAMQFRRGSLLAYLASSGAVSQADLRQAGSAVDAAIRRALGDAGATAAPVASAGALASGSPSGSPPGSPPGSPEPSGLASPQPSQAAASPAAPELEALMPTQVSGTALSVQSATGDQVLGTDAASKALTSALASFGKKPADLQLAQAYDPTSTLDVTILGFRVPGLAVSKLEPAVLQTWLFAGATGVTTKQTTVSGVAVTEVTYGGDTSVSYVLVRKDSVLVVQSGSAALAAAAIAALP
jgi:hypothetical protein